jgi:hypothetical protein
MRSKCVPAEISSFPGNVPESNRIIPSAGDEHFAIGREGDAFDSLGVSQTRCAKAEDRASG